MDDRNKETLADIVAEMRANAKTTGFNGHIYWDAVADRIKAAAEREARIREDEATESAFKRGEEIHAQHCANCKARAPGNTFEMREGLRHILRMAQEAKCTTDSFVRQQLVDNICSAAAAFLALPARNCDRFQTAVEAASAWQAYSIVHRDRDYSLMETFNWLFAKAEGKETEGDNQ